MKKLAFLLTTILLVVVNSVVFGQSKGETPAPGAAHNYYITDNGNQVKWTVTKSNLTDDAGSDANIANDDQYSTDITWNVTNAEIGTWYYVHVVETDGDGCSNEKVLPVQITESPFYLTLAAANPTACYDSAVSVSLVDPSTVNYVHGEATLEFTVTPTDLSSSYTGYTFNLTLTVPDGYSPSVEFSGNASLSSGTVASGIVEVTDNSAVTITYTIDNTNVYTNSDDSDAADFVATVGISGGTADNGVSDNENDGTYNGATSVSRPHTSGIGTN